MNLYGTLASSAAALGFAGFGAAAAAPATEQSRKKLENYLESGRCGDMDYMGRNLQKRLDITLLVEECRSVMAFLAPYDHHEGGRIASFAFGEDYHKVIKDRIHLFVQRNMAALEQACGSKPLYRVFTDSAPVLEREWAVRCGVGFIGCNNFLISPTAGLRTLIGILAINLPFEKLDCGQLRSQKERLPRDCGGCLKCIKACPTGALEAPYTIDARRCVSYLTIESRRKGPVGEQIFGCDRCMDACPWNCPYPGWPEFSSNEEALTLNPENIFSIFARNRK